jgi:fumarate hydratase class II
MPDATNGENPRYTDVQVGINAQGSRSEFDSLGSVDVPADRYWGAQTQRSLIHFSTCRSTSTTPTVW